MYAIRSYYAIPAERVSYALNSLLPDDIIIVESKEVEQDFHARYSAQGKKYRYLIYNRIQPSAFLRNRACHVRGRVELEAMRHASQLLVGTHNFKAFCAAGAVVKSFEREIYDINICKEEGGYMISIDVFGSGFLYNMVRIISGTLIEIGLGKRKETDIIEAIETGERGKAGKTAPAHALYLMEVLYSKQPL